MGLGFGAGFFTAGLDAAAAVTAALAVFPLWWWCWGSPLRPVKWSFEKCVVCVTACVLWARTAATVKFNVITKKKRKHAKTIRMVVTEPVVCLYACGGVDDE